MQITDSCEGRTADGGRPTTTAHFKLLLLLGKTSSPSLRAMCRVFYRRNTWTYPSFIAIAIAGSCFLWI